MQPVSNNVLRNMLIVTIIIGVVSSTWYFIVVDKYTFATPISLSLKVFQQFKMLRRNSNQSNTRNDHGEFSFNVTNEFIVKSGKEEGVKVGKERGSNEYIEEKKELMKVLEKKPKPDELEATTSRPRDLERKTDPVEKRHSNEQDEGKNKKEKCKFDKKNLGFLRVDDSPADLEKLRKKELDFVQHGGQWSPTDCVPREELAIVIPYRNREQHLGIFLRHMHQFLKSQNLKYRIFVIEQDDNNKFNRGKLMNVGFKEALKRHPFKCFAFHDVDLMPEDSRNDYGCPNSPRHLSVGVDKFDYILLYDELFGGVEMFLTEHYEKINGFSNAFWGWGGEDDNLYFRVINYFTLTRPSVKAGRYKMLEHLSLEKTADDSRFDVLDAANDMSRVVKDGLNSLKYKVKESVDFPLYTLIKVDLTEN